MNIELDRPVIEGLLNYLASRPWAEVNNLIGPLLQQFEAQASKPHLVAPTQQPAQPGQAAPAAPAAGAIATSPLAR